MPAWVASATVDAWTLAVALLVVVTKIAWRRWHRLPPYMSPKACGKDLLDGTVIVPFGLMVVAVFWSKMPQNSALLNGIAGLIGLFFVLGEILTPPPRPPISSSDQNHQVANNSGK